MAAPIKLQCRPELLEQWQGDIARNPREFARVLALSPEYLAMLVNDAVAAAWLQAHLAQADDRSTVAVLSIHGDGTACRYELHAMAGAESLPSGQYSLVVRDRGH